ncbi:MAG: hypothetical protein ACK4FA_01320 [Candidatus Paceibacteria bacterium]
MKEHEPQKATKASKVPEQKTGVSNPGEITPLEILSEDQIKSIVFDLLGEEGKTPESYEITKDQNGVQNFVLKFTDGTTNEHSVKGVLGLRLNLPILNIEGIEQIDNGKNFKLLWKEGVAHPDTEWTDEEKEEIQKSAKELALVRIRARKKEIADLRTRLLERLNEIEREKN